MHDVIFADVQYQDKVQDFLGAPGTVAAICGLLLGVTDIGIASAEMAAAPGEPIASAIGMAADAEQLHIVKTQIQAQMNLSFYEGGVESSLFALYTALTMLFLTLDVLMISENLNGIGSPNQGSEFTKGMSEFDSIYQILNQANPEPGQWSGQAAELYEEKELLQQERAATMAAADMQIAAIAQRQAGQVEQAREGLASTRAGLATLSLALAQAALTKYSRLPEELNDSRLTDRPNFDTENREDFDPKNQFASRYTTESAAIKGFAYTIMILCFLGASTMITLLGLLIDHGRINAQSIRKVFDDYRSIVTTKVKIVIAPHPTATTDRALPASVSTISGVSFGSNVARRLSSPSRRFGSTGLSKT